MDARLAEDVGVCAAQLLYTLLGSTGSGKVVSRLCKGQLEWGAVRAVLQQELWQVNSGILKTRSRVKGVLAEMIPSP